jgi:predicted nucleotidyltransferase
MNKGNVITRIQQILENNSQIQLAIIYGSCAAGTATAQSDIDLAVASAVCFSSDERLALAETIAVEFNCEVDLVDLESAHGALLQEILTRGALAINRSPSLYEKFIKRMLAEKEDDSRVASKAIAERIQKWSPQTKR